MAVILTPSKLLLPAMAIASVLPALLRFCSKGYRDLDKTHRIPMSHLLGENPDRGQRRKPHQNKSILLDQLRLSDIGTGTADFPVSCLLYASAGKYLTHSRLTFAYLNV